MEHSEVVRSISWMTKTKLKDISEIIGVPYSTLSGNLSSGRSMSVTRFTNCIEACGYKVVVMPCDEPMPQDAIRVDGDNYT